MGQQESRDELLYNQALKGNVQAIEALCRNGAGLEWIDEEGKTPLIVACMSSDLFVVAKTLIELGANVNAYRSGHLAGTPLHHAAERGLHQTVDLLLSCGANPLVRNDDCQTPLDVARMEGSIDVVCAIESHVCFFSGWLREFYGPGFLEALAPQLLSRKIWVVIIPCGPHDPTKPLKLELVIYPTLLDCRFRTIISLWKAIIEEPNFHQSDPVLIMHEKSTKTRYRFASANDADKQQLQLLYNACRGIPQVMPPLILQNTETSVPVTATQTIADAEALALAVTVSIQSAMEGRLLLSNNHQNSDANNANGWGNATDDSSHNSWGSFGGHMPSKASSSGWMDEEAQKEYNGWGVPESRSTSYTSQHIQTENNVPPIPQVSNEFAALASSAPLSFGHMTLEASSSGWMDEPAKEEYNGWGAPESRSISYTSQHTQTADNVAQMRNEFPALVSSSPSAPPLFEGDLDEGSVHYPCVSIEHEFSRTGEEKNDSASSSLCVICWEAPAEGACIPCGHMAVCMTCLNEIKSKQGACPLCRAKIDEVIKIYAV